jgi:hypothetical protein
MSARAARRLAWGTGVFLLIFLILVFPDGRLPGPRRRWIALLECFVALVSKFGQASHVVVALTASDGHGTTVRGVIDVEARVPAAV